MVLNVIDYVNHCYSNSDGEKIRDIIFSNFQNEIETVISFKGINAVSSSFINSAFIDLLEQYSFEYIKSKLRIIDTNKGINEMIKRRFDFEVNERKKLISV